jgi:hypothetical protein
MLMFPIVNRGVDDWAARMSTEAFSDDVRSPARVLTHVFCVVFHMVPMGRTQPYTRAVVEPQPTSWLLLLRNLQPLATPDTLHAILAHPPAGTLEKHRDPAIPVTAVLAGKLIDRLRECLFVFTPDRAIALRATRLVPKEISPRRMQTPFCALSPRVQERPFGRFPVALLRA